MSPTKIVKIDPLNINEDYLREAADIIKAGGLVIIPTETVYGLAANMLDKKAIKRLSAIKKRPKDKPFSIAIDRKERLGEFAKDIPISAYKLINKFWPGPVTLILKGINQPTVVLRMPDNEIAQKIISAAAAPIALPSANISGKPAPESFEAAIRDLNGLVELAIDGGELKLGMESTIVDLTGQAPQVVRFGAINDEEINKTIYKKHVLFVCSGNTCRSVIAEALFKKMMRDKKREDVEVYSAGVMALSGSPASQGAKDILAKDGIDVSGHIAREVTRELLNASDLILVMEKRHEEEILKISPEAKNRVFLLKEFAKINDNNLDIVDPVGKPSGSYQDVYYSIKESLERISNLI